MKKIILGLVLAFSMICVSAQVMAENGVINTVWTGFGTPDSKNRDVNWYGVTDTLQARVDIGQFTMEGMINWGFFTSFDDDGRRFEYTGKTAFYAATKASNWASSAIEDSLTDAYYVNFLWHPIKGLDLGAGSRLNWTVGPAPSCSDYYWGKDAHVKQGGLKFNTPGLTDVAGFVYYPNTYTSTIRSTRGALGIRFNYTNIFEGGIAIPSGTSAHDFSFNVGLKLQPIDFFNVSFAYEGVCKHEGHLYTGLQLFMNRNFTLNLYMGIDNLGGEKWRENEITGLGISADLKPRGMPIRITPEFGMTFYKNKDYTTAINFGSGLEYEVSRQFTLGAWLSFAWGSRDLKWEDNALTKDFISGTVFDIRPKATMYLNSSNSLTAYADYQARTTYNNISYASWAAGVYWTYKK